MEGHSSTQSFSNLQHHHHRPTSFPLTLSGFQSPDAGYPPSYSAQDSQDQYGGRAEESTASFLASNASSGLRRGSSGSDRVFLTTSGSSLDGDAGLGGHFGGESRLGSHFDDSWYGKKGIWDDGESGESAANDFHSKTDCYSNTNDVFCTMNCAPEEGDRWRIRSNYNSYGQSEGVCSREGSGSHFSKQVVSYSRTDSKLSDHYAGGEEDYGSSCGSGEDQLQPAEAEGSWLTVSPTGEAEVSSQAGGRWRGAADDHSLGSGSPVGVNGRTYPQKLDSFSEAFLPQRRRRFQMPPDRDSGQIWENGLGRGDNSGSVKSRQSCAFEPDTYLHPSSSSLSSSFPSPPTSSHLMSSVLSPPPTPLPPPSQSPSKADSPSTQGGSGHVGGESLGGLQFFSPRIQSSGIIWKFPLLSHCFPQLSADPNDPERGLRSSQGDEAGNTPATCDIFQSPEPSSLTSSAHRSSLDSSRPPCPSTTPSPNAPFPHPFHQFSVKQQETIDKITPYKLTQKVKIEAVGLDQQHLQEQATPIYTGKPFPSILHSKRAQNRGRYTPRPLLNPSRRATGLFSSLSSIPHRGQETAWAAEEEEEEGCGLPYINVGSGVQADLPPYVVDEISEEDSPREQLVWKPWDGLQESASLQGQVEKLLSMCSSSCLPGGGTNTELALHCLHHCKGNTMAALEMLLFSQPSPAGDYHYSGCDFWTDTEKHLFGVALGTYGKDFQLIEKMVRTKTVSQCVEFYYQSKKLEDKQKKQKEEEVREAEEELQKSMTPISQPLERPLSLEEVVPVPSLASFFPCKLCGKMFYKIKSRNAHMKIHRQPQEDWTDRRLQHQLLTQRLALTRPANLIPSPRSSLLPPQASSAMVFSTPGLASSTNSNPLTNSSSPITPNQLLDPSGAVAFGNITPTNSHLIAMNNINGCDSNRKDPSVPFHQPWSSFGHLLPDLASFYCLPEGKEEVGAGTVEGKEAIGWQ